MFKLFSFHILLIPKLIKSTYGNHHLPYIMKLKKKFNKHYFVFSTHIQHSTMQNISFILIHLVIDFVN